MAAEKKSTVKGGKTRPRKKKTGAAPASRGLTAGQVAAGSPPAKVESLRGAIEEDGGTFLGAYRDPVGGHWHVLAALPIAKVAPTRSSDLRGARRAPRRSHRQARPLRRSDVAARRGGRMVDTNLSRLLPRGPAPFDRRPIPTRRSRSRSWRSTPRRHNIREKALRYPWRAGGGPPGRPESDFALEFEEPALLTLGCCYEKNGRFAGGAYNPVLKRVERFLGAKLPAALAERAARAEKLLALDEAVTAAVKALKARGFESPYLKAFVVARVNPIRFQRGGSPEFDATIEKMTAAARRFDAAKVRADQLAAAGGAPAD
jgi:ParB family chromosome partitioning protein